MDLSERTEIVRGARNESTERYDGPSTTVGKLHPLKSDDVISRIRFPKHHTGPAGPSDRDKSQLLQMVAIAHPATGVFDPRSVSGDLGVISRNASSQLYSLTSDNRPFITEKGFLLAAAELSIRTEANIAAEFEQAINQISETERTIQTQVRIGQQVLKKSLLKSETVCQVTELAEQSLLRASHIRPWADPNEIDRLNPRNALLLAVHLDACFDRLLISFGASGELLISPKLSTRDQQRLGIAETMVLRDHQNHQVFLAEHRIRFANKD